MDKLSKEEVEDLAAKIRLGEGSDSDMTEWLEEIMFSTAHHSRYRGVLVC